MTLTQVLCYKPVQGSFENCVRAKLPITDEVLEFLFAHYNTGSQLLTDHLDVLLWENGELYWVANVKLSNTYVLTDMSAPGGLLDLMDAVQNGYCTKLFACSLLERFHLRGGTTKLSKLKSLPSNSIDPMLALLKASL